MKKMRLLISIILMGLSYSAYPMNPDTVTVECSDGKEISVPRDVARKVGALHGCLDTCTDDNNHFSLKDVAVDVNLDSQTLQNLFLCIQDLSNVKELSDEDKNDLCIIGDYLSVDEKRQEDIIFRIINYCDDFDELSEKARSLIKDLTQQLYAVNTLNLANKRVDSLQNIERIVSPEDRHAITAIDCHGNQIRKLDFKKLKDCFPKLKYFNAQVNCINDVSVGRIGQQELVIDLLGNCLSEQEVEKIKRAINSKDLSYIMLNGKRILKIILFNLVTVLRKVSILSNPLTCLSFFIASEDVFMFMSIGSTIGVLATFTILKDFNQRLQLVITEMDQELQRRKNTLNIEHQISPKQQQRIRDRFVALGNNQHNGGLKLFARSAVNNLPHIVTRSYR